MINREVCREQSTCVRVTSECSTGVPLETVQTFPKSQQILAARQKRDRRKIAGRLNVKQVGLRWDWKIRYGSGTDQVLVKEIAGMAMVL